MKNWLHRRFGWGAHYWVRDPNRRSRLITTTGETVEYVWHCACGEVTRG